MKKRFFNLRKKQNIVYYFIIVISFLLLESCNKDDDILNNEEFLLAEEYDSKVVIEWYDLIKTLTTETNGYTPPVASRAFGYISIALYEAVEKGIPDKTSLSGKLNEFEIDVDFDKTKEHHWALVANIALAEMVKYFYANTSQERYIAILELEKKYTEEFMFQIKERHRNLLSSDEITMNVYNRSILLATKTVNKIISWSTIDGGFDAQNNNFPSDYFPPQGTAFWEPTPPDFSLALQPYWGSNRPFLTTNIDDVQPVAPPIFSDDINSTFFIRAKEVYDVVSNVTTEQIKIAEFWSDDPITSATPPGHSISILNQLITQNKSNLAFSVEAFARLGIGISDAFISCWKTKYETNYPRPVTYINKYIDPNWSPILITPPFPEYTSGHSVQSGALAEIMTSLFGEEYKFSDRTHENRNDIDGSPRSYNNFYEMAQEAAISRLYGGIHFKEAIELGLEQGYQIGKNVNKINLNR